MQQRAAGGVERSAEGGNGPALPDRDTLAARSPRLRVPKMGVRRPSRRLRRALLWLGLPVIVALLFVLLTPLVAVRIVKSEAQRRGWEASLGRAELGLGGLWLKGVRLTRDNGARIDVQLQALRLPWKLAFGIREVQAIGGNVTVFGSVADVRRLLGLGSDGRTKDKTGGEPWDLGVGGLSLQWSPRRGAASELWAWGVSLRRAEGPLEVGIDRIRIQRDALLIDLTALMGTHQRTRGDSGASADVQLGRVELALDLRRLVGGAAPLGAAPSGEPSQAGRKLDEPERASTAASLLDGRVLDSLRLGLVGLRDRLPRLREELLEPQASSLRVNANQVSLRLIHGDQQLNLGPWQGHAERDLHGASLTIRSDGKTQVAAVHLAIEIPRTQSPARARTVVGPLSLAELGIKKGDLGLTDVTQARITVRSDLELDSQSGNLAWKSTGDVANGAIQQTWLSSSTVSNIGFQWDGRGSLDFGAGSLQLDELRLALGAVNAKLSGSVRYHGENPQFDLSLNVPLAACRDLTAALPDGLAPLLSELQLDGTLSLEAALRYDAEHLDRTDVRWSLSNHCKVAATSPRTAPERWRETFLLEVEDEDGRSIQQAFGPGTWTWVPLTDMPSSLTAALLVCEDGRFFGHSGIDPGAIRNSLVDNLQKGRFFRGGSTITMQLAKNLYLRKEKTIARKIQEAALTQLLEQSMSKHEILELYLNVIEFGPGVYGIGPAAKYYFATSPRNLSTAQSFYLISILPNPKIHHFGADGSIRPGWRRLLDRLMQVAKSRGHLTSQELAEAESQPVVFGKPDPNAPPELPAGRLTEGEAEPPGWTNSTEYDMPAPVRDVPGDSLVGPRRVAPIP